MWLYLAIFALSILVDVLYVTWVTALQRDKMWLAACAGTGISACGVLNLINIVDDHWLIAPYLAGAFVGVILGSKLKSRIGGSSG